MCNQPLMNPREYRNFMEAHEWKPLSLPGDRSIPLTAGFLRNHGLTVRISKGKSIAANMLGFNQLPSLLVSAGEEQIAQELIQGLLNNFTNCESCGHVLLQDEDCTYCSEEKGSL